MSRRAPSIATVAVASSDLPIAMTDEDEVRFITTDGQEEDGLTVRGFLKLLAGVNLEEVRPALQPRLRRFQERATALWSRELIRPNPRDIGDMLMDEFGGRKLDEALGRSIDGDSGAFEVVFERILDACAEGIS